MHLNYLLAFDGIIASQFATIGCSCTSGNRQPMLSHAASSASDETSTGAAGAKAHRSTPRAHTVNGVEAAVLREQFPVKNLGDGSDVYGSLIRLTVSSDRLGSRGRSQRDGRL